MAWTIYRSTDSGAPVLNGQTGKILDLLDAILVNGYGSKPAAGWVTEFTASTKRVYRPGPAARSRLYLRCRQDVGWYYASYSGYSVMTDIDTGTDPFPSTTYPGQTADVNWFVASYAVDSTTRSWMAAADDRTLILFTKPQAGMLWLVDYIGEFESYATNDAYQFMVAGTGSFNVTPAITACALTSGYNEPATVLTPGAEDLAFRKGMAVAKDYTGIGSAVQANWLRHVSVSFKSENQNSINIGGKFPSTNPVDGRAWITHIPIYTYTTPYAVRGQLRGLYAPLFRHNAYSDGDTFQVVSSNFSGSTQDLASSTFTVMKVSGASEGVGDSAVTSVLILQTSGNPRYT